MQLHIKLLDGEQLEFNVPKDSVVVGRSNQCDVIVPHEGMSRRHCQIELKNGEYYVTDLGSINGVFIEDKKIRPNVATLWPVFLNLSFGVIQSLQIEPESTKITRIPGQLTEPKAASNTVTKPLDLEPKKTVKAQDSSRPKPLPKKEDSGRKRIVIMGALLVVAMALAVFTHLQKQDAPLTPEEMYE